MSAPDFTKAFAHGTRSRYVHGCHCAKCRAANRAYANRRYRAAHRAAVALNVPRWKLSRACCGLPGRPCPGRHKVRKDSTGGLCHECRMRLVWNGLVDAAPARAHLLALSRQGVGRRAVAAACDVSLTHLTKIKSGVKTRCRQQTLDKILAVDRHALADGALVPAKRTWTLIAALLREGYTKTALARGLGYKSPALQIGRRFVLARTAMKIERLHRLALA